MIAHCVLFNPDTAAAQQIEVVAVHMNNYIKQLDNSKKMLALQKKFTGSFIPDIIVPGRQFVKEGRLMKVSRIFQNHISSKFSNIMNNKFSENDVTSMNAKFSTCN